MLKYTEAQYTMNLWLEYKWGEYWVNAMKICFVYLYTSTAGEGGGTRIQ